MAAPGSCITELGRPTDKANRAGIGGSIAAYVRRREIFTRPAPNTFGLIESNGTIPNTTRIIGAISDDATQPPPEFGQD